MPKLTEAPWQESTSGGHQFDLRITIPEDGGAYEMSALQNPEYSEQCSSTEEATTAFQDMLAQGQES